MMSEFEIDAARRGMNTGVPIRAKAGDRWCTVDISQLTRASMLAWLRSAGGSNRLAENVIGVLLGYGQFHDTIIEDCAPGDFYRDKAARELRDALEFFDRVSRAPETEQVAVGRDHWNRLIDAVRASVLSESAHLRDNAPDAAP